LFIFISNEALLLFSYLNPFFHRLLNDTCELFLHFKLFRGKTEQFERFQPLRLVPFAKDLNDALPQVIPSN
jgi:hypothetical protein